MDNRSTNEQGWHSVGSGRIRSLPNNGNGDCLFQAPSHQLQGAILAPQLRQDAVNFMSGHLEEFGPQLLGLGWDMVDTGEIAEAQRFSPLLPLLVCDALRLPWTWGGAECIAAVCRMLRRPIIVYQEEADAVHFHPDVVEGETLRILHRFGQDQRRTHYESVLQWEPPRDSVVPQCEPSAASPHSNNGSVEDEPPMKVPRVEPPTQAAAPAVRRVEPPPLAAEAAVPDILSSRRMVLRPRLSCFSNRSFRTSNFSDAEDFNNSEPRQYIACFICDIRVGRYALIPCGHSFTCGTCVREWFIENNNVCTQCGAEVCGWTKVYNQN